jgi:hypothetical protein
MPVILDKVMDAVRPGSRRSSTSSVRRQSKLPRTPYPDGTPLSTPREATSYPEVPEVYYNARLDPKNFLEGKRPFSTHVVHI